MLGFTKLTALKALTALFWLLTKSELITSPNLSAAFLRLPITHYYLAIVVSSLVYSARPINLLNGGERSSPELSLFWESKGGKGEG